MDITGPMHPRRKSILMKFSVSLLFVACTGMLSAQNFTRPDSVLVAKNQIKAAKVYAHAADETVKQQVKEYVYDKNGRVLKEREDAYSFWTSYTYDQQGRKTSSTRINTNGIAVSKFTMEYDDANGNIIYRQYKPGDTLHPIGVTVNDSQNRNLRRETYSNGRLILLYTAVYDTAGNITSYDSSAGANTAAWYQNRFLLKRRTYDPAGNFLHEYRYTYDYFGRTWKMTDSTGQMKTVIYEAVYAKDGGPREGIKRNETMMSFSELRSFEKEHPSFISTGPYIDPEIGYTEQAITAEHTFTYDQAGNIVRDELKRTDGASTQTFVYTYEYEFQN